ncbi:hypothetical protein KVT40_004342 [Elsinoe batatas]|uniref:Uncharacterized protein n=1 Tax=Elsinoe batatas TaxID=2601811 RepID=A0A8K0PK50_9PEZI|nr:hypothetical protein KVT40_004342 [Elsinoe batatas]
MHFPTLATLALGLLAISPASAKCLNGPKRAGDVCLGTNEGNTVCGPGQDGNIVRIKLMRSETLTDVSKLKCVLAGSRFIWRIDGNRCNHGGCKDCKCNNGRVA